jgi:hypothetical protein
MMAFGIEAILKLKLEEELIGSEPSRLAYVIDRAVT